MKKSTPRVLMQIALIVCSATSYSQTTPAQTHGELLYLTHCVACHTTQMHWRKGRLATDWDSLKVQVRRWQGNAGLQWGEADIEEVSRYLNETIYRYPTPADRVGLVSTHKSPSIRQSEMNQSSISRLKKS